MVQTYAIYRRHILIQTQNQVETVRMKEDESKQKRELVVRLISDKYILSQNLLQETKGIIY